MFSRETLLIFTRKCVVNWSSSRSEITSIQKKKAHGRKLWTLSLFRPLFLVNKRTSKYLAFRNHTMHMRCVLCNRSVATKSRTSFSRCERFLFEALIAQFPKWHIKHYFHIDSIPVFNFSFELFISEHLWQYLRLFYMLVYTDYCLKCPDQCRILNLDEFIAFQLDE